MQGGGGARLTGHIQIEGNEEQLRQTINDIEARSEYKTINCDRPEIPTGRKFGQLAEKGPNKTSVGRTRRTVKKGAKDFFK